MDDEGRKLNSRVITIPVCLAAAADDIPSGLMAHVCASSPPSVRSQTVGKVDAAGRSQVQCNARLLGFIPPNSRMQAE